MNLCIYTGATDKSAAAVTSTTNTTAVTALEDLILGDSAPLSITFTDGSAAPSWAGAAGYTLSVGLGTLDGDGGASYTRTTDFSQITGGWSGRLSLATQLLIDALKLQVGSAVDWTRFPTTLRTPYPRPAGGWFSLQIAVTDTSGNKVTYAELRVFLRSRVLPTSAASTASPEDTIYAYLRSNYVQNRTLVGIAANAADSTLLCGISTRSPLIPVGARILAGFPNNIEALFEFVATTSAITGFLFAPFDYSATDNPYKWRLRAVYNLGVPCVYNADTAKWHYVVAVGAANAVALAVDQTGLSLPT